MIVTIVNEENLREACEKIAARYKEQRDTIAEAEDGQIREIFEMIEY